MSDPTTDQFGYGIAAERYWAHGWRGILPLPRHAKKNPPKGFTGKQGVQPSYADVLSWADLYPHGNVCLRLPDGIIGIDVDAYGAKTGGQAFAQAEHRWGPLPPTIRTTSRTDGISGIRLYRVPPGTRLVESIEFPDLGLGDIEIVQRGHRYAICWPSIHPEGGTYWWLNHDGQIVSIPHIDDIPDLPQKWLDNLPEREAPAITMDGQYPTRNALTPGEPSARVAERLRQAIKELNLPGHSRHVTVRGHVLALLRLGKTGEPGVERALSALGEMFIALVAGDRAGGRDEATHEYKAMVTGPGAARELAQPSNTDWAQHITADFDPKDDGTDRALAEAGTAIPSVGAEPIVSVNDPDDVGVEPYSHLEDIERGFWDARDSLKAVWTTAMSRMCSPWAVLAHTAARALTQVRPCVQLPPLIGGPGSLNWFAAVTAASGGGKGSAAAAARLLIPTPVETRNMGSGEGIVAMFGRPQDDGDPTPMHEALLFTADEIDTITALGNRTGSTTMSVLRSGFSGETLGFSYAAKEKRRHIQAHTYRMTLVISVQPERAGGLMGDAGGGTPQRFMWFPGTDNRITASPPWEAGPLVLPPHTEWTYPRELKLPDEARQLILKERVKAMRGQADALDGHALFVREKFAFALAVLDGRTEMTMEDWELSGIVADISTYTRTLVTDALGDASGREAAARGAVRGIEMDAADVERDHRRTERGKRVLRWLLDKLAEAGTDGLSPRELTQKVASRDRPILQSVLVVAVDDGLIKRADDGSRWVKI